MKLKTYFESKSKEELERLALDAKTNYFNLRHIFLYQGSVSGNLAVRIADATNGELDVVDVINNKSEAA